MTNAIAQVEVKNITHMFALLVALAFSTSLNSTLTNTRKGVPHLRGHILSRTTYIGDVQSGSK